MKRLTPLILFAAPQLAWAEAPKVVTDIAPVHSLVAQVMGDIGQPELLLDGTADPHHVSLKPSQARAIDSADLVVWIGHSLTPWLEEPVETLGEQAHSIELLNVEGTQVLETREAEHHDEHDEHGEHGDHDDHAAHSEEDGDHKDHGDDHGKDTHDDHDDEHKHGEDHEDHHDHGKYDPHAWLDPQNATLWLQVIAEELAEIDPQNADAYRANANAAQARIAAMEAKLTAGQLPSDLHPLVMHDSFQYFEHWLGLETHAIYSDSHASDPGPKHIAELREDMGEVNCIWAGPEASDKTINLLNEGYDVPVARMNQLGTNLTPGADLYDALLTNLVAELKSCGG